MDRMFTLMCLLLFSSGISAQDNPLEKDKWVSFFKRTNYTTQQVTDEQALQSGYWHEGLLIYKDGSAHETSILFTSLQHFCMPNGRLKTTTMGEVSKKDLQCFVINNSLWAAKGEQWGIILLNGPLVLFSTFHEKKQALAQYIIDEDNQWLATEDLASSFKKKMQILVGDYALLASKIQSKETNYRYSDETLPNILHEYNEWIRIHDPERYRQIIQLTANR